MTSNLTRRLMALALVAVMAAPQLLLAATSSGIAFPQPHSAMFVSRDQEIQLGQQAAQEARKQYPVLPDNDPLTQYLRYVASRLVPNVPEPRYPYEFHMINQKDINAFALPGGPVFVNVGALQAADNDAEFAGVVAHEMSHVYMRHGAAMASKAMMAQLPLGVLGAVLGSGTGASLARIAGSLVANGLLLRYSRDAESEADAVGARLMYLAGWNPRAMADFFTKLEQEGGARGPQFLSDHPNPGNRAGAIQKLVATFPPRSSFQGDSSQFRQAKQIAMGRRPLTAEQVAQQQKQGGQGAIGQVTRDEIRPSDQMQALNHSAFTVSYPSNWKVSGDQNSGVTIFPEAGVSQSAIAYGVIINGYDPESRDLDGGLHELEAQLRQSNPDLRVVTSDENIRVNGVPGKSVEMIGPSPVTGPNNQPLRERDWMVAFQRGNGSLVYIVFISPENDFNALRPTYEKMLRSFKLQQ